MSLSADVSALAADTTVAEDPSDPTTMASLHVPFFFPSPLTAALGAGVLGAGVALGVWLQRRRAP